jgi:hypothetical protein
MVYSARDETPIDIAGMCENYEVRFLTVEKELDCAMHIETLVESKQEEG